MKKYLVDSKVIRIIDVNSNRLTEGLRVCEDIVRFILNDAAATRRLKKIRHKIFSAAKTLGADKRMLLAARDSRNDIGKISVRDEKRRSSISDIFEANMKRCEESMRVLEEFSKLSDSLPADRFKKMRFELYSLEKAIIEKL